MITAAVAAGNASGLFPAIAPSGTPSPAPGTVPQAAHSADPASRAADVSIGAPGTSVLTAQVLGLIALALAVLLTITRLAARIGRNDKH